MAEKNAKMESAQEAGDEYEILPHKELHELREELNKLKQQPTEKTLHISMVELASKLDRMMDIFKEAQEMIRVEEGALTFQEKMRPLMDRMDKVLQQNSQIAEGIVGLHDLLMDLRDELVGSVKERKEKKEDVEFIEPFEGPLDKESAPKESLLERAVIPPPPMPPQAPPMPPRMPPAPRFR